MKTLGLLLAFVVVAVCFGAEPQWTPAHRAQEPAPLFMGTALPLPPEQGKPWKPPASGLSEKWTSALEELVRHGFADPRGCEYRQVKFACGGRLVAAHAWAIPQAPGEKQGQQRFAVAWDGLVYPVVELGPAADFKADVEAILAAAAKMDPHDVGLRNSRLFVGGPHFLARECPEVEIVSHNSLLALKSCLLCRLGEGALAERVWKAWVEQSRATNWQTGDPYLLFTEEWGWALYKRATGAHLLGDHVISLTSARMLVAMQEAAERIAARRGPSHTTGRNSIRQREALYLGFADSPVRLVEDESRRLQAKPVERALDVGLQKFPDQPQRIAALVRDLEVVDADDFPPFAYFSSRDVLVAGSPVVKALIKEGPPAVEPLLECLASDRRLTLAVVYHGKFVPQGCDLIAVDEAAFAALRGILKVDVFGPKTEHGYRCGPELTPQERRAVADEIRRFWQRHKGRTGEEVWLGVLADREATPTQWLEVAGAIVEPVAPPPAAAERPHVEAAPGYEPEEESPPLAGEALRSRKNPSVAESMARRADDIAKLASSPDADVADGAMRSACELTVCLARWDRKAALPAIHRRFKDYQAQLSGGGVSNSTIEQYVADSLTLLAEAGAQAGDDTVVDDYAAWIRGVPAEYARQAWFGEFLPVWRHPENPKLAGVAHWAFLPKESPWHPNRADGRGWQVSWASPLLVVPEFRELLKRELTDAAPIGTVTFDHDEATVEVGGIPGNFGAAITTGNRSPYAPERELPKSARQPLRACDKCALSIAELAGSPRFELYWPEKKRDAALAELAAFIDRWGHCFRDLRQGLPAEAVFFPYRPRFYLAPLSRPATPEDVADGRAIFSLRDRPEAQVRAVPLKPYPSIARWKTLRQFPFREPGYMEWPKEADAKGLAKWDHVPKEFFDREGYIWQAEEVLVGGKWRRYYGFAGSHIIAKVPAEEIEILDEFSPAHPPSW
jgi:hypothetical protein